MIALDVEPRCILPYIRNLEVGDPSVMELLYRPTEINTETCSVL